MREDLNRKLFWAIVADPLGIVGMLFMLMGVFNVFLYGVNLPENPEHWNYLLAWLYPLFLFFLGIIFFLLAIYRLRSGSRKFIKSVKKEARVLRKKLENVDRGDFSGTLQASEFGVSMMDLEILSSIRDSGGFIPVLVKELEGLPFDNSEILKSVAKLWLMGYINIPSKVSTKLTLTVAGMDILELPRLTFTTKVPEDIALMVAHANVLYRNGNYQEVILKCYTILERALKVHLIPSIDEHARKWNEKVEAKYGKDAKGVEKFFWNGAATKASLNELWNFYKKHANMTRKWSELTDRMVKYTSKYVEALDTLNKEELRVVDKGVDVVADVRSAYAHDKISAKYEKDAYRMLRLMEIVLGIMFDTMKTNAGLKSRRFE